MRVDSGDLAAALSRQTFPAYLVSGDEPLLSLEAADEIRQHLHDAGYTERELFDSDRIPWDQFAAESNAMSLFGDKRLLEVRTSPGRIGDAGAEAIEAFCAHPPEDAALLIITGKLDRKALGKSWVKCIEKVGLHAQVWPVQPRNLPGWLSQRLRSAGIEADRHAIEILAERVEGNLLAARQEIDKLLLLADSLPKGEPIDARTMASLISDSSRYDVFTLVDRALEGNAETACRTLRGLREEGVQPLQVLFVLARELRTLIDIQLRVRDGMSQQDALVKSGVWKTRQQLVRRALQRCPLNYLQLMLRQARGIDQAVKGNRKADEWLELTDLVLNLCGQPALKPQSIRAMLG